MNNSQYFIILGLLFSIWGQVHQQFTLSFVFLSFGLVCFLLSILALIKK